MFKRYATYNYQIPSAIPYLSGQKLQSVPSYSCYVIHFIILDQYWLWLSLEFFNSEECVTEIIDT